MLKNTPTRANNHISLWSQWSHSWKKSTSETGVPGFIIRWAVLILFALYFFIPIYWLVLATTKSAPELLELRPLAFGSIERLQEAWRRIIEYQDGEVFLWAFNSIKYVVWGLALSLAISFPRGIFWQLRVLRAAIYYSGWTLITMLLPPSALVLPLFMEFKTCSG
jgi:multiple sugar transport system permease protein